MSIETVNEPIEGHNPFLGMEVPQIADRIALVDLQMAQTSSPMLRGALGQNKGWLQEALYVEITWNRIQSERES